jgi:hypothetical protein
MKTSETVEPDEVSKRLFSEVMMCATLPKENDMKTCLRLLVLVLSGYICIGYVTSAVAQSSGSTKGPGSSVTGRPAPKKQDEGAVNRGTLSGGERGSGASGTGMSSGAKGTGGMNGGGSGGSASGTSSVSGSSSGGNGGNSSSGSSSPNQTNDTGNAGNGSGGSGTNTRTPNSPGNGRSQ